MKQATQTPVTVPDTDADGKTYTVSYYNLDMIINVGYRVNSHRGVQVRQWATRVLKEYMIKGFAVDCILLSVLYRRYERRA